MMPPPRPCWAILFTNVSFVNIKVEPSANSPPPPDAVLPESVDAVMTRFELWKYNAPPLGAVFPTKVLRSMIVVCIAPLGVRKIAPPRAPAPPALDVKVEPHTVTVCASAPSITTAPPLPPLPDWPPLTGQALLILLAPLPVAWFEENWLL